MPIRILSLAVALAIALVAALAGAPAIGQVASYNPTFRSPGATVGTTTGVVLVAGSYGHVQIQNVSATTGTVTIACAWGGPAALNSPTSSQLSPGQGALWGPNTNGVPGTALSCISTAANSPLYLELN